MISTDALYAFSILIAGIIALVRFKNMGKLYRPFIFCVWIACVNEILSYSLIMTGHYTSVNNNIYVLGEALLFLAFFRNMGVFDKVPWLLRVLGAGLVLLWLWENLVMGKIMSVSSWFRITYSFLIVLMSITVINKLMLIDVYKPVEADSRYVFGKPVFLISIGAIAFFTFKLLVEIFWYYGLNRSVSFRIGLYDILIYINLVVNLIYALAILWIPRKRQYITL